MVRHPAQGDLMARKPKDAPPSSWGDRKLVVLEGGPRDGWWYFADSVEMRATSAERMGTRWPYKPTGRTRLHPDYSATGQVHTYVPEAA